MSKHRYQAVSFKAWDWGGLCLRLAGKRVAVSIDVAKDDFYAALMSGPETLEALFKWVHPLESRGLLAGIERLAQEQAPGVSSRLETPQAVGRSLFSLWLYMHSRLVASLTTLFLAGGQTRTS